MSEAAADQGGANFVPKEEGEGERHLRLVPPPDDGIETGPESSVVRELEKKDEREYFMIYGSYVKHYAKKPPLPSSEEQWNALANTPVKL